MMEHKDNLILQLRNAYFDLYGYLGGNEETFSSLLGVINNKINERARELKELDMREHDWFMNQDMVGMMLYVDLFSDNLRNITTKIPYLKELGITYVHLMPLLKPRDGENDGGYAVEDYRDIDPNLGTLEDFIYVVDAFRHAGIAVCIDYVLNHTADTHEWAKKALAGDRKYQDMYMMYDNRELPDVYDRFVPEVLPDKNPGNFTYKEEINRWVFTSFSYFQWDLNYKNPYVFEQMVDIMLYLGNLGVNIVRFDAIAFMWKEPGTTCRNLEQAHKLMNMFHLIKEIAMPSLVILGEAIVEPDEIFKYFGRDDRVESGLLYNANLMVNIYNSLATRDVRLMQIDNNRFKPPKTGCFMNYIRCHDDIGWGFNENAVRNFGLDPLLHKRFLIDFYSGFYEGSFAKGEIYQFNPRNNDARTNGTLASLLGLEKARRNNDSYARYVSLNRIKMVTALIFSHRGIPLIYSGDEIATLNDHSYKTDPNKKYEGRWVHRPYFDWERAEKRNDLFSDEGEIFNFTKNLINIRKQERLFNGKYDAYVLDVRNNNVYVFYKNDSNESILFLYNFSEDNQYFSKDIINQTGFYGTKIDLVTGKKYCLDAPQLHLHPYEFLWLKN